MFSTLCQCLHVWLRIMCHIHNKCRTFSHSVTMIFAKTCSNDAPMLTPYFHSYMFLDRHRSYELGFVRPSVRSFVTSVFSPNNHSRDFSDFVYGYGALWEPFSGQNPNLANNDGKRPKTAKNNTFFRLWQKAALRIFLIFGLMLVKMILYHSSQTTCPGKFWFSSYGLIRLHYYFFRLWQRRFVIFVIFTWW